MYLMFFILSLFWRAELKKKIQMQSAMGRRFLLKLEWFAVLIGGNTPFCFGGLVPNKDRARINGVNHRVLLCKDIF